MKKNIGIWLDTKQAFIIKLTSTNHFIKIIESGIETRERFSGESKKYGRFGGQYITFEKNRENKITNLTNQFIKNIIKEIENCESVVLFGPSTMKTMLQKEILSNLQLTHKLVGVKNSDALTENQMVAWVKNYYTKTFS